MNDRFIRKLLKAFTVYVIIFVLFMLLFTKVFMFNIIPSGSMENTIMTGDFVFSTRFGISEQEIQRYDIVVFIAPDDPELTYIKRVIGLPGETIEVKDGRVYADGVELDDSFVRNPMNRKGDGVFEVPEGSFFLLGDNRNQSHDSRFWDHPYVPVDNIKGKAKYVVLPVSNFGSIQYEKEELN